MKAELSNDRHEFQPVRITLVFETQRELDAFGKFFNNAHLNRSMEEASGSEIDLEDYFSAAGADINGTSELTTIFKKNLQDT